MCQNWQCATCHDPTWLGCSRSASCLHLALSQSRVAKTRISLAALAQSQSLPVRAMTRLRHRDSSRLTSGIEKVRNVLLAPVRSVRTYTNQPKVQNVPRCGIIAFGSSSGDALSSETDTSCDAIWSLGKCDTLPQQKTPVPQRHDPRRPAPVAPAGVEVCGQMTMARTPVP